MVLEGPLALPAMQRPKRLQPLFTFCSVIFLHQCAVHISHITK